VILLDQRCEEIRGNFERNTNVSREDAGRLKSGTGSGSRGISVFKTVLQVLNKSLSNGDELDLDLDDALRTVRIRIPLKARLLDAIYPYLILLFLGDRQ
jgi:hypothetical protein